MINKIRNKYMILTFLFIMIILFIAFLTIRKANAETIFLPLEASEVSKVEISFREVRGYNRYLLSSEQIEDFFEYFSDKTGKKKTIPDNSLDHDPIIAVHIYLNNREKPVQIILSPDESKIYYCYSYESNGNKLFTMYSDDEFFIKDFIEHMNSYIM